MPPIHPALKRLQKMMLLPRLVASSLLCYISKFSQQDSPAPETKTPLQELLSQPLSPPSSTEVPLHNLPPHITLMISEETSPSFTTLHRGTVNSAGHDTPALEEVMPLWLLEYLLHNKLPSNPPLVKVSFILLPWPNKDPDGTQLPELLNMWVFWLLCSMKSPLLTGSQPTI